MREEPTLVGANPWRRSSSSESKSNKMQSNDRGSLQSYSRLLDADACQRMDMPIQSTRMQGHGGFRGPKVEGATRASVVEVIEERMHGQRHACSKIRGLDELDVKLAWIESKD